MSINIMLTVERRTEKDVRYTVRGKSVDEVSMRSFSPTLLCRRVSTLSCEV